MALQVLHLEAYGCHLQWKNSVHQKVIFMLFASASLFKCRSVYLCFLLNNLFSLTFLPPPSVTLEAPSFHLSGTITCTESQITKPQAGGPVSLAVKALYLTKLLLTLRAYHLRRPMHPCMRKKVKRYVRAEMELFMRINVAMGNIHAQDTWDLDKRGPF